MWINREVVQNIMFQYPLSFSPPPPHNPPRIDSGTVLQRCVLHPPSSQFQAMSLREDEETGMQKIVKESFT